MAKKQALDTDPIKLLVIVWIGGWLISKAGEKVSKKVSDFIDKINQKIAIAQKTIGAWYQQNVQIPIQDSIEFFAQKSIPAIKGIPSLLVWLVGLVWEDWERFGRVDFKIDLYPDNLVVYVEDTKFATLPLTQKTIIPRQLTAQEALEEELKKMQGQTEGTRDFLIVEMDGMKTLQTSDAKAIRGLISMINIARQFVKFSNFVPHMMTYPSKTTVECKDGGNMSALFVLSHYLSGHGNEVINACSYQPWPRDAQGNEYFGAMKYNSLVGRMSDLGNR